MNAATAAAPISHRSGFCHFHSNAPKASAATAPNPAINAPTTRRSSVVCARMADVPSKLSTGVRSQNRASAATSNNKTGRRWLLSWNATPAPVTMGASNSPHAPCSRGSISARQRSRRVLSCAASSAPQRPTPSMLHSFAAISAIRPYECAACLLRRAYIAPAQTRRDRGTEAGSCCLASAPPIRTRALPSSRAARAPRDAND